MRPQHPERRFRRAPRPRGRASRLLSLGPREVEMNSVSRLETHGVLGRLVRRSIEKPPATEIRSSAELSLPDREGIYFSTLKSASLRRHQSAHSGMVLKACLVIDSSALWISGTRRRARLGASGSPTTPPTPGRPPPVTVLPPGPVLSASRLAASRKRARSISGVTKL